MASDKDTTNRSFVDVCIVGAGPAGSSCAYHIFESMNHFPPEKKNLSVLVLDRAPQFPRHKICGHGLTANSIPFIRDMGVYEDLRSQGKVFHCIRGGIGATATRCFEEGVRTMMVYRSDLDDALLRKALSRGAEVRTGAHVFQILWVSPAGETKGSVPKGPRGHWIVRYRSSGVEHEVRCYMLVAADGAMSVLAHQAGLFGLDSVDFGKPDSLLAPGTPRRAVQVPPNAYCTSQRIDASAHTFPSDTIVLFRPRGYCALFRHHDGALRICVSALPKDRHQPKVVRTLHDDFLADPQIRAYLPSPPSAWGRVEVAPLRLGGVARSTTQHFMAIGDAAGHGDPIFGEGLCFAIEGGKYAGEAISGAFARDHCVRVGPSASLADWSSASPDLSAWQLRDYHRRCMLSFGYKFRLLQVVWPMVLRRPFFLDLAADVCQREQDMDVRAMHPAARKAYLATLGDKDLLVAPAGWAPPPGSHSTALSILNGHKTCLWSLLRPRFLTAVTCALSTRAYAAARAAWRKYTVRGTPAGAAVAETKSTGIEAEGKQD
eukprot:gnl/Trimastix_PCT/1790.p1 GENE.gnl/Trimastix_PCT/1790~~gnl/Trimastix_PCT/1790.p1  ORF type:complete len:546 (-),score=123.50 gnl/Trimastix_PCT/1790:118-1755(-)